MDPAAREKPKDGVSPKLKITVIAFSLFTLIAFTAFFVMVFNRVIAPIKSDPAGEADLLVLADKLKTAGLPDKAIEQYQEYLRQSKPDRAARARIAVSIADLFVEMGDCRDALVWLYKAELSDAELSRKNEFNVKIDACQHQVNLPQR
ncbi:MAG: tetratricopeptide repeat protein [Nitrospinae bacterium]|nr:tetratricopeptide repeat protein [Nitrospinota bacterium]